ncbi:uncharacterized protein BDZ99DRAFT_577302 [Mytilinidion resinicola]|uniref:Uncharacterized protein n=1 Tax=Mytilinidion resinicola TaxID=574789 RepID=A0A6A6XZ66_9PEZI|nr:uncharacterized protein BDZ99DRAFT_577302 [Mytilinidion resinicola]KAF2801851.1 hypothetical protein BDZ99DRAFT_577302 [Mytilinidion resinicola]
MYKPSILRPALHVARQTPIRVSRPFIRHASTEVKVQRVRFKKRMFTRVTLASLCLYSAAYYTYFQIIGRQLDRLDEGEGVANPGRGPADSTLDEDDELEPIFIPLGLTKARPKTYYKGSDPEWQEFRKLAPDQKKHARMRDQLVTIVRTQIANDKRFKPRMGDINITLGAHWLDITFPDGPPTEYERSGIEIGDHIAWTARPVSELNYHRLNRALYPSAVFSSVLASSKYLVDRQTQMVKRFFNLPVSEEQQKQQYRNSILRKPTTPTGIDSNADADATQRSSVPPPPQVPQVPGSNPQEKNVAFPDFSPAPPKSMALSIFASTLAKNWQAFKLEPPRGTVVVSGLIEIKGSKARMTMDVNAAYDPKQDKFVMLQGAIRRIQDMSQRPKGGN